jgi:hypothetical protein
VKEAGGKVRIARNYLDEPEKSGRKGKEAEPMDVDDDKPEVVPLRLLKRSNEDQMNKLFKLLYLKNKIKFFCIKLFCIHSLVAIELFFYIIQIQIARCHSLVPERVHFPSLHAPPSYQAQLEWPRTGR